MSFDAYLTKDGQWVQLLGVDYKKHVPKVFKSLGIGYGSAVRKLLSSLPWIDSPMALIPILFYDVTKSIRDVIGRTEWKDLKSKFDKDDIWYTTVASPEQALENEQARVTRAFRWRRGTQRDGTTLLVNSPCQTTAWRANNVPHVYGEPDSASTSY